jgi:hypothetical protein
MWKRPCQLAAASDLWSCAAVALISLSVPAGGGAGSDSDSESVTRSPGHSAGLAP